MNPSRFSRPADASAVGDVVAEHDIYDENVICSRVSMGGINGPVRERPRLDGRRNGDRKPRAGTRRADRRGTPRTWVAE